jgi:hypothetical protein
MTAASGGTANGGNLGHGPRCDDRTQLVDLYDLGRAQGREVHLVNASPLLRRLATIMGEGRCLAGTGQVTPANLP